MCLCPGFALEWRSRNSPVDSYAHARCYAIVLLGRKSGFRDGFRSDSIRESLNAALRPAEGRLEDRFWCFPD